MVTKKKKKGCSSKNNILSFTKLYNINDCTRHPNASV